MRVSRRSEEIEKRETKERPEGQLFGDHGEGTLREHTCAFKRPAPVFCVFRRADQTPGKSEDVTQLCVSFVSKKSTPRCGSSTPRRTGGCLFDRERCTSCSDGRLLAEGAAEAGENSRDRTA